MSRRTGLARVDITDDHVDGLDQLTIQRGIGKGVSPQADSHTLKEIAPGDAAKLKERVIHIVRGSDGEKFCNLLIAESKLTTSQFKEPLPGGRLTMGGDTQADGSFGL